MKKLTASALLAGALVFGTAVGADYYNDLETNSGDPIPIVDIRDGIGFVRASQYSMPFFDIEMNEEENFVFSRDGDELCITPGSVTALFNGETVTMPGAPYLEDGELYVPIRFLCDTFDIRLAFSDKTYPEKVTLYAGKDVQPMSGLIGDSFNNWSITIPEGWYYYPDSVDGSTATFNTFNGMRVAIAMIDPADPTSPSSTGLEDYLLRREVFTGADGRKYIVQGEIYSHPTAEARAQLNAVIDSFAVGFSDGAHDVSNISEDGTRWEMTSFCPGISLSLIHIWKLLAGDLVHVRDHKKKTLRRGIRCRESACGKRSVNSACCARLGLHLNNLYGISEDVLHARGSPFVCYFRHG